MKLVAAYMLAVLGGNTSPSADDVNKILRSVGAEADNAKLESLLSQLKGKDITQVIASGRELLAYVPYGGAVATVAPAAAADIPTAEEKKEDKVEDEEEEEGADLGDLFGDGGLFGPED